MLNADMYSGDNVDRHVDCMVGNIIMINLFVKRIIEYYNYQDKCKKEPLL